VGRIKGEEPLGRRRGLRNNDSTLEFIHSVRDQVFGFGVSLNALVSSKGISANVSGFSSRQSF
jgi:hypothetical protein